MNSDISNSQRVVASDLTFVSFINMFTQVCEASHQQCSL